MLSTLTRLMLLLDIFRIIRRGRWLMFSGRRLLLETIGLLALLTKKLWYGI